MGRSIDQLHATGCVVRPASHPSSPANFVGGLIQAATAGISEPGRPSFVRCHTVPLRRIVRTGVANLHGSVRVA
jgi:hypothetical protein